jgi:hypothetical protein
MSKKDSLIKEIEEVGERVRFWHNAILAIMSALIAYLFALSQGKVMIDGSLWLLIITVLVLFIVGIYRLESLNKIRKRYIKELEKED